MRESITSCRVGKIANLGAGRELGDSVCAAFVVPKKGVRGRQLAIMDRSLLKVALRIFAVNVENVNKNLPTIEAEHNQSNSFLDKL